MIGQNYVISVAFVYKIITKIEQKNIKSNIFNTCADKYTTWGYIYKK